jgi:type I restriction enzyme S subunit
VSEFGEGEPLPKGWRRVRLGELLAEAQPGFASSARSDDGVVQLRMNNVRTDGRLDWSSVLRVPTDADQIAFYALRPGDIVFNNTNSVELVGKSALVPLLKEPIVYSNHFTRLRCNPHAEPRFIARWLQSAWRRKVFEQGCDRWVGQAGYQRKKLLALELPIPSPVEQRRIVDLLDLQSAEIERAREAALAQLAIDALAGALLAAAFRGDL